MPPSAPARAAASVRPSPPQHPTGPGHQSGPIRPGAQYGRPDTPDSDFGAVNGYAGANDYGFEQTGNPDTGYYDDGYGPGDYDQTGYEGGYEREVYESGGFSANNGNGYDSGGFPGSDQSDSGEYKARRHRPSANDTNVGTLADFASYGGYQDGQR
jgi:hypothetical protein